MVFMTQQKENSIGGSYKFASGQTSTSSDNFYGLTKYNTKSNSGNCDNLIELEMVDDAAYQFDNTCRIPTLNECSELINNTTSTWTTNYNGNGMNGMVFVGSNGKSIFIPAAGYISVGNVSNVGIVGRVWANCIREEYPFDAYFFGFDSSNLSTNFGNRSRARSIRPVRKL